MNLDDATLRAAVAKAVIDTLTPETKASLLTEAVKSLLSNKDGASYNSPTVIQSAFNLAVGQVAREVALEQIKNDPVVKDKIKTMINDAWERVTGNEYAGVVVKLADAITKGLTGDRY